MNSLCLIILLVTISTNVSGDSNNVQTVNVTCEQKYSDPEICTVPNVNYRQNHPSVLSINNREATTGTVQFELIGHYEVMPLNLFELFPKLVKLQISTGLDAITKDNLIGGHQLKELELSDNKIRLIKAHTFDGMDKLVVINLYSNKLTKIESNAFAGAVNLKRLNLNRNEIDTIEVGAFNVQTLERIDLSINKLRTLADGVFTGCTDLKSVSLYGNELTRIGTSIDNVPKLNLISFNNANVRIVDFNFYAIARMPHLRYYLAQSVALVLDDPESTANDNYAAEYLDISGNDLSYPDILHRLRNFRHLTDLKIGKNNFKTINEVEKILEIFPQLYKFDVSELPCQDEIVERLQTKFGEIIEVRNYGIIIFHRTLP